MTACHLLHLQNAMKLPTEFILEIDLEGIDLVEQAAPLNPFFQASLLCCFTVKRHITICILKLLCFCYSSNIACLLHDLICLPVLQDVNVNAILAW